jgi:hypothetical protein
LTFITPLSQLKNGAIMTNSRELTDIWTEQKTTYSITDEHGEKSSITIDKWAADFLQDMLPDVHSWVQEKYDLISEKHPQLSRRKKGDALRDLASMKAKQHENYYGLESLI